MALLVQQMYGPAFDSEHREREDAGTLSLLSIDPLFRGWGLVILNLAFIYPQKDNICPINSFFQKEHYSGAIYTGFRPQDQVEDGTLILGPQVPCGAADFQGHVTKSPAHFCLHKATTTYRSRFWLPGRRLWANGSSPHLLTLHVGHFAILGLGSKSLS